MREHFLKQCDSETIALLKRLDEYLSGKGVESYIIGGFVRDMLLERPLGDIDIAVKADAQEIGAGVAGLLEGKHIPLDEKNGISRVVVTGREESLSGVPAIIDFSSYKGTIRKDLARRDFAIDAMAVRLRDVAGDSPDMDILDPFGGQEDIREERIRAFDGNVFVLDPVRLLRGVRLAAELGFSIETETEDLIREHGHMIFDVPGERTRDELLRLLRVPGAGKTLKYLDDLDMLTAIFPELEESRGVEQPKEHYWGVLEHSLATVEALEYVLGEGPWEYVNEDVLLLVPIDDEIHRHLEEEVSGGSTRKTLLKLAALLHDTGKPLTKALDENGRTRFLGHAQAGAELIVPRLEKLRFSGKEIKIIETEVIHHMRPTQLSQEGMPTDRAIYRYFRDTGSSGLDILFLNLADHLATRGPDLDMRGWKEHTSLVEYVIRKRNEKENIVNPTKILSGYDIMNRFGLDAGPAIGKILEALREAQASGEVKDREEALSFVRKILQTGDFPVGESGIQ